MLRAVPDKEFLHTKNIINKDVYVDYGATEDIRDACSFSSGGSIMNGDLTTFKSRWLKF